MPGQDDRPGVQPGPRECGAGGRWHGGLTARVRRRHAKRATGLSFNLSHTLGLVATAIGNGAAVGINVESTDLVAGTLAVADRWLATSLVHALGDSAAGPFTGTPQSSTEVEEFLKEETAAWNRGAAGVIAGSFDPECRIVDAVDAFDPAGWIILFSGLAEYADWLESRLQLVDYELEREILHSSVGPTGTEALAVGHERLSARHQLGTAQHAADRVVVWTLSKRTGDWLITDLILNVRR